MAELKPGPAPTGRDKIFDALYGAFGGKPENRWLADKATTAIDWGTLGMLTGAYEGGKELASSGRPGALAMALMPGAKIAKPALQALNPLERAIQAGFEVPEMAAYKAADGRVFKGADHSGAIINAERELGQKVPQGGDIEGFVTSNGRYVTRDEASGLLQGLGLHWPSPVPGLELHSARVRQIRAGHLSKSELADFEAALSRGPGSALAPQSDRRGFLPRAAGAGLAAALAGNPSDAR